MLVYLQEFTNHPLIIPISFLNFIPQHFLFIIMIISYFIHYYCHVRIINPLNTISLPVILIQELPLLNYFPYFS